MFQVLPGPPGTRNRTVTQQAQTPALACYTPALRAKNRKGDDYVEWLAGIFAQEMPAPRVSGYPLRPDDPVTAEWSVILITSTRAGGIFAHATRERDSFRMAICDSRELVLEAARSLIERMQVHDPQLRHTAATAPPPSLRPAASRCIALAQLWSARDRGCPPRRARHRSLAEDLAHCIDGQANAANRRINDALGTHDSQPDPADEGDGEDEQAS